jgi:hypothetical protein
MPCFRRRIQIQARASNGGGEVRTVLEDDFHHFRVAMLHRDGHVSDIHAEAPRHPYTECPAAAAALRALIGMVLTPVAHAVTRHTDASGQCTHMFDLAGLAIAAAARGLARRTFEIEIPRHIDGRSRATLLRDDGLRLEWEVEESRILAPAPYAGQDMRAGMARWALASLPPDEAEAALVLRRCALISLGRRKDIDTMHHARPSGLCYAQQPERAPHAIRIVGSTWDFTGHPERLCIDDATWLQTFGN